MPKVQINQDGDVTTREGGNGRIRGWLTNAALIAATGTTAVYADKHFDTFDGHVWDFVQRSPENGGVEYLPIRRDLDCAKFEDGGVELAKGGKVQDSLSIIFLEVRNPGAPATATGACVVKVNDPETGKVITFTTDAYPSAQVLNL